MILAKANYFLNYSPRLEGRGYCIIWAKTTQKNPYLIWQHYPTIPFEFQNIVDIFQRQILARDAC